ncbi:MAG: hypothetical protein AAGC93_25050 [Cyanobacteria bacterium P01_F01_bin.53]
MSAKLSEKSSTPMPKIPECDSCQYFVNSPYMVCGVNPSGPEGNTCEDFSPSAEATATQGRPFGGGVNASNPCAAVD